jgi:lipopolysaccharide export system protein LptA
MRWHKPARFVAAIVGIACAIVVYATIGERETVSPPPLPARIDPTAVIESIDAQVQQDRGTERDFDVSSEQQLFYEDGSSRLFGVVVQVRGRQGRDFVLKGREARSKGRDAQELQLVGEATLEASDGFSVSAESASFSRADGFVRAPGPFTFKKGGMSGRGLGMAYDQTNDVLSIAQEAEVTIRDDEGTITGDFSAGTAVLDRALDRLTLDGNVDVERGEQVFESDSAIARLTPHETAVTMIELRGHSRVTGGKGALEAMSARDIDLDYSDDGETLERVLLNGEAMVALADQGGEARRQMAAAKLDLSLSPDGGITRAVGSDNVQLQLPATDALAARAVRARLLDATGEPGRGLTIARFSENVEYREDPTDGSAPRLARALSLRTSLDSSSIGDVTFNGNVTFEEQGLRATAAEARYEPTMGTLRLSGADAGGPPRVSDERMTIEAQKIDVTLKGRSMAATGGVKTALRSAGATRVGSGRGVSSTRAAKLPGLLNEGEPANVTADSMQYEGESGRAVYAGSAALWQGETAIRGDVLTIDQLTGDLVALGNARSVIALESGHSIGSAAEIRYDEVARMISLLSHRPTPPSGRAVTTRRGVPPPPASRGAGGDPAPAVPAAQAQLRGPQQNVSADRIEVALAGAGRRVERLEAYVNVSVRIDSRVATGARLTHDAGDGRYVMSGVGATPVKVNDGCRETSGRTVTFFTSADRIIVDGDEEIRTQTNSGGLCAAVPSR